MSTINNVVSMMYPSYLPVQGTNALVMSKPPLVTLQLANLICETDDEGNSTPLLGWINSFNANPDLSMGMFTIGGNLFPKVYNATLDFTPQHLRNLAFNKNEEVPRGTFPYGG